MEDPNKTLMRPRDGSPTASTTPSSSSSSRILPAAARRTLSRTFSKSLPATGSNSNNKIPAPTLQRSPSVIREYHQRWIGALILSLCLFFQIFLSVTTTTSNHAASISEEGMLQHLWESSSLDAAAAAERRRSSYSSTGDHSHLTTEDWLALTPTYLPEPPRPGHGPTTTCPVDRCLALGNTPQEQYPNRIVFRYIEGGAGLMDRLIRLRHLMTLGAMLCATVEIPPPKALLCKRHNGQHRVPRSLTWHDLAAFEFLQQDENATTAKTSTPKQSVKHKRQLWSPMVLQDGDNKSATLTDFYQQQREQRQFQEENPGKLPSQLTHFYYNNENGTNYLQDMYDLVQRMIEQKQNKENDNPTTSTTQESFLWLIKPRPFWDFLKYELQGQLQKMMEKEQQQILQSSTTPNRVDSSITATPKLPSKSAIVPQFTQGNLTKRSCGAYVRYRHPPRLLAMAKMVLLQAMAGNTGGKNESVPGIYVPNNTELFPPFGFFHIRRGDATTECDTEFDRMKSVVNCSLSGRQTKDYLKAQVDPRNITTDMVPAWMIRDKPLEPRPFIIFFATDDQHTTYRRSIRRLLERQPLLGKKKKRPWIRAVDLDKLIKQVVQRQVDLGHENELGTPGIIPPKYATNNYIIFAIGKILSSLSLFTLSQRKARFCEDCSQDMVESAFVEYVQQERLEHSQMDDAALLERQEDKWNNLEFVDK